MNNDATPIIAPLTAYQAGRLREAVERLFLCCQERLERQTERFDLPPAETRGLLLLGQSRYLTPSELATLMGVTKSRITAILTGLTRRGLIERRKDPGDSRVSLISLSAKGKRTRDAVTGHLEMLFTALLDTVPPEQRETLLISLETLGHCMEQVKPLLRA